MTISDPSQTHGRKANLKSFIVQRLSTTISLKPVNPVIKHQFSVGLSLMLYITAKQSPVQRRHGRCPGIFCRGSMGSWRRMSVSGQRSTWLQGALRMSHWDMLWLWHAWILDCVFTQNWPFQDFEYASRFMCFLTLLARTLSIQSWVLGSTQSLSDVLTFPPDSQIHHHLCLQFKGEPQQWGSHLIIHSLWAYSDGHLAGLRGLIGP